METPVLVETFIETCKDAVAGDDPRRVIHAALVDLVADPAALAAAIPPSRDAVPTSPRGFRLGQEVVLHRDDDLSIIMLSTLAGVWQPPHDHEMVALIGVFEGCEEQRFWVRTETGISSVAGRMLEAGEVMTLGERAIHAISAPLHHDARAIHVYLGDIHAAARSIFDPDTLTEHPMSDERYDEFCRPA